MTDDRTIPFKVDIAGVIEIMGTSLYSRIDTPIRELIQNAHDAITRRRKNDLDYQGRIDIVQDTANQTLSFTDDGVGLSLSEAEDFLGTLGIGITGLLKGRGTEELREAIKSGNASGDELIGQFGIGLFSAFMLADKIRVESRKQENEEGVFWEAGAGTDIVIRPTKREKTGTTVTLHLKDEYKSLVEDADALEQAIKQFADFLTVPIFLNNGPARINVINVAWFHQTPDEEAIEMELASYFNESPLDVIPIRIEKPVSIAGALYISPQRTPGFADDAVVAVTVRRMVISRRIHDLIPPWGSFLRGVLELQQCSPTASREDLVRDNSFQTVQRVLESHLFAHFEKLANEQPRRLEAIVNWHRYTLAGAALHEPQLRQILRKVYKWQTSRGSLTFQQILDQSEADPINETEADFVFWYNADRRQERWINELFNGLETPCVHTLKSFEEQLLAAMISDCQEGVDLRIASPSSPNFAESILGMSDMQDAPEEWSDFLECTGAKIMVGSFRNQQPVMSFLNERYELAQTFEDLKKEGQIPAGFQRMIESHFQNAPADKNEVVLNRNHRLVKRAMEQGSTVPLASVLRLLVVNSLNSAGASVNHQSQRQQMEDLDWIAEALWGKD